MVRYLVTGGLGYIGSHIVKLLKDNGDDVIIIDNLSTGNKDVANRLNVYYHNKSIINQNDLFYLGKIDCIIHLAAFSQVGESVKYPSKYYYNNVCTTIHLLDCMIRFNIKNIIFSSTAAVYGNLINDRSIVESDTEKFGSKPINPYGQSKLMIETIIKDYHKAYGINYVILRYFNAAGAYPDGLIGEDHKPETHLIPLVLQVPLGKKKHIEVFGNSFNTRDGTCIRDYVHVCDIADAHILSSKYLIDGGKSNIYNIGSGKGHTVKEIIDISSTITGYDIPIIYGKVRDGDPEILEANPNKIISELSWKNKHPIDNIIKSAWIWHKKNPNGYKG